MRQPHPEVPTEQADASRGTSAAIAPRHSMQTAAAVTLAVLAVFYTLSTAADIILPLLLAVVFNLLLQPPMRVLRVRLRLPASLSALLVIVLLFGVVAVIGAAISVPAASWLARVPQSLPRLEQQLKSLAGPVQYVEHGLEQLEHLMAQGASAPGAATPAGRRTGCGWHLCGRRSIAAIRPRQRGAQPAARHAALLRPAGSCW